MTKIYNEVIMNTDVFHFNEEETNFETFAKQNGFQYWLASDLALMLGYTDTEATKKAINKAMSVCTTLNIPILDNFVQTQSEADKNDLKLSRFACYLTVMNGDIKNPKVASAQAYFVGLAEAFQDYIQDQNSLERVLVRGEVTEREKSLSSTAHQNGVVNYPFFQNAGYRGMYNMNLNKLKAHKGLKEGTLLDYMGKEELAANLFRITQTESKIKKEGTKGQTNLEKAAETVGREVRNTMIKISGTKPEELTLEKNIQEVRKGIKQTNKALKKLDNKSAK